MLLKFLFFIVLKILRIVIFFKKLFLFSVFGCFACMYVGAP